MSVILPVLEASDVCEEDGVMFISALFILWMEFLCFLEFSLFHEFQFKMKRSDSGTGE